jgi:hypothetical protein
MARTAKMRSVLNDPPSDTMIFQFLSAIISTIAPEYAAAKISALAKSDPRSPKS